MPPGIAPNNNPAPTTDLGTAYGELADVYDPQTAQVQTQLDAIPGQTQTAMSSLDQAKANAFKTNATNANARGVLFGGVIPQANQDYTTNTYDPNVKKVNDTAAANTKTLQQKITDINQERANSAQSLVTQTQAEQAKEAASAAGSSGRSGSSSSSSSALPQGLSYKNGSNGSAGFNFNLGNGALSAARYAQIAGIQLPALLQNMAQEGDATAAQAYQALQKSKGVWTPAIQKQFSSIFWGV